MHCNSCEVVMINGLRCHETGCTEAWRDKTYICKECGQDYKPTGKHDNYCESCQEQERLDIEMMDVPNYPF